MDFEKVSLILISSCLERMSYGQENVNGIIPAVEAEEVKETMYTSNFRYENQVFTGRPLESGLNRYFLDHKRKRSIQQISTAQKPWVLQP